MFAFLDLGSYELMSIDRRLQQHCVTFQAILKKDNWLLSAINISILSK